MTVKFLKLTETARHGEILVPVLINPLHIVSIKVGMQGKDTHISMGDGKYFFVRESVSTIEGMLAG